MQYDDPNVMMAVVQEYIYQKTGKRVRIVLNDPMKIRMHVQMLTRCYLFVIQKQQKDVN